MATQACKGSQWLTEARQISLSSTFVASSRARGPVLSQWKRARFKPHTNPCPTAIHQVNPPCLLQGVPGQSWLLRPTDGFVQQPGAALGQEASYATALVPSAHPLFSEPPVNSWCPSTAQSLWLIYQKPGPVSCLPCVPIFP